MRVVAGTARGRKLTAPRGRDVRPTTDRVREAIFNALRSLDAIDDASVLDLFAGTGALGIEALSRGAAHATFVDQDRVARASVSANLSATGLEGRATVVADDASRFVARHPRTQLFDLVLLDPPYAFDSWMELLDAVAGVVADGGVVVVESPAEPPTPTWGSIVRVKSYGSTVVTLLRRTPSPEPEPRP
ncbi:MAG TPA: 16S rRNA (guanine(966)-N(2))-methyltransferase RsmD [Acidimicrobiales bacterium]|nr:16S rRNA (guanine(966)-N(2))-methyltransferase RsmD [Acidimicrobiales bacterium]